MIQYLKGAFFLVIVSIISVSNDAIMKYSSANTADIVFWRSFFSTLILLPFVLFFRPKITIASTQNHFLRALIFGSSMMLFIFSLKKLPLAITTSITFSVPIWVVILARIFLKEKLKERLLAVIIAMLGIIITCIPIWESGNMKIAMLLIASTIGFASLDVFNKYLLNKEESMVMMLFGSSFGITLLSLPFFSFSIPQNLAILAWLGVAGNLLLYFLLKAWAACDISALQPIKFIDFPLSLYLGSRIFQDSPHTWVFFGVGVLIVGVLINIVQEIMNANVKK